jgi:pseudouridine-5'-phosphate glycosidase
VTARVDSVEEVLAFARAHWELVGCGLLLTRPPDESLDVDDLIEEALAEAEAQRVRGQELTPFVLARLHERSGGRTLAVNRELAAANAQLAAELAVAAA